MNLRYFLENENVLKNHITNEEPWKLSFQDTVTWQAGVNFKGGIVLEATNKVEMYLSS